MSPQWLTSSQSSLCSSAKYAALLSVYRVAIVMRPLGARCLQTCMMGSLLHHRCHDGAASHVPVEGVHRAFVRTPPYVSPKACGDDGRLSEGGETRRLLPVAPQIHDEPFRSSASGFVLERSRWTRATSIIARCCTSVALRRLGDGRGPGAGCRFGE